MWVYIKHLNLLVDANAIDAQMVNGKPSVCFHTVTGQVTVDNYLNETMAQATVTRIADAISRGDRLISI